MRSERGFLPGLLLVVLSCGALAAPAGWAVELPFQVNHEGLLLAADGLPMTDQVDLTFRLCTTQEGASCAGWSESHADVPLLDGYYTVRLGSTSALGGQFGAGPRWLEIEVDGTTLSPRQPLTSVPFALVADNVVGDITPKSIKVNGSTVIDSNGNWTGAVPPGAGYNTPAAVLQALRSVDGAGTDLNADLLDDVHAADFLQRNADFTTTGDLGLLAGADGIGANLSLAAGGGGGGNLTVGGGLTVAGASELTGALVAKGSLEARGALTAKSTTDLLGAATAHSGMTVVGLLSTGDIGVAAGSKLGVGVPAPLAELDVGGTVRADRLLLNSSNTVCGAGGAAAGTLRWSGTAVEVCNGTAWAPLTAPASQGGFAFSCYPPNWGYSINGNGVLLCSATIDLPVQMAVIARVNSHWKVGGNSEACTMEVLFDNEQPTYLLFDGKHAIHGYQTDWKPAAGMWSKVLAPGAHTVRYAISGKCEVNGSALHGLAIPTQGLGQEIACVPADISYRGNTTICTANLHLAQRSAVVVHVNGHVNMNPNNSCGGNVEILWGDEADGAAVTARDGLHFYDAYIWQPASTSRVRILEAGQHSVRYRVTNCAATATLNRSSLRGVVFPAVEGAMLAGCTPPAWEVWPESYACSTTVNLAKDSLLLAHVTGHMWVNPSGCVAEILVDGEERYNAGTSAYNNKDGIFQAPSGWIPIHFTRSKALAAGQHTLRYALSRTGSGSCQFNGSSLKALIVPR